MSIHPSWIGYAAYLEERRAADAARHQLIYVAAPYSKVDDKEKFMAALMRFTGQYMMDHPGQHLVSPLFNHYSLDKVPGMAGDYAFWGDYSRNLLRRCDKLMILMFPGWDQSTGVADEIKTAEEIGMPVEYIDITTLQP